MTFEYGFEYGPGGRYPGCGEEWPHDSTGFGRCGCLPDKPDWVYLITGATWLDCEDAEVEVMNVDCDAGLVRWYWIGNAFSVTDGTVEEFERLCRPKPKEESSHER